MDWGMGLIWKEIVMLGWILRTVSVRPSQLIGGCALLSPFPSYRWHSGSQNVCRGWCPWCHHPGSCEILWESWEISSNIRWQCPLPWLSQAILDHTRSCLGDLGKRSFHERRMLWHVRHSSIEFNEQTCIKLYCMLLGFFLKKTHSPLRKPSPYKLMCALLPQSPTPSQAGSWFQPAVALAAG